MPVQLHGFKFFASSMNLLLLLSPTVLTRKVGSRRSSCMILVEPSMFCAITPNTSYLADPLNAYAHFGMPKPFVHLTHSRPSCSTTFQRIFGFQAFHVRSWWNLIPTNR